MFADKQGLSVMVFSTDESTNKAVVCAGVPEKGDKGKLDVSEWLTNALGPLKGRCGKGKGGLATGQVSIYPLTLISLRFNSSFSYIIVPGDHQYVRVLLDFCFFNAFLMF